MKNVIILEKVRKKEMPSKNIANTTALVKIAQISIFIDLARRYNWIINYADVDAAKKLEQTGIKK